MEDIPEDYEIISETDKTIGVVKPNGEKAYICKICGEELPDTGSTARHYAHKHRNAEASKRKKQKTPPQLLTPEEEMLEEMCETLRDQMEATPGIGSGQRTDWFIDKYFRNTKAVQDDPSELFKALSRYFPKVDEDAISLIVKSINDIKGKYRQRMVASGFGGVSGISKIIPATIDSSGGDSSLTVLLMKALLEQQEKMYSILLNTKNNNVDIEGLEARIENKFLQEKIRSLEEKLERTHELINSQRFGISPEGWHDDYARLIAETSDKLFNLGEKLIVENKKTRQMIIRYIAPRLIGGKEHEPIEESTDSEIVNELEKEGLVE